jgi:hypothetical protein
VATGAKPGTPKSFGSAGRAKHGMKKRG